MSVMKNIEKYDSFSEILADTARVYGQRVFLVEGDREYSYSEFGRLVNSCCRFLMAEGVKKGDIVSLILKNSTDYLIVYFATLKLGGVINPFPFHLGVDEVIEKLLFVRPAVVFVHQAHGEKLRKNGLNVKIMQSDGKTLLADELIKYSDAEFDTGKIDPDATAFMYYSSGTTGSPKIIEYTGRSEILTMASLLRAGFMGEGAVHLCFLPLGHTAAIRYSVLPCLLTGSRVVLFESYWKIRPVLWQLVARHKATFFEVVPSILVTILHTQGEDISKLDISSLQFIGCGSAYLSQNMQDEFEQKYGIPVANMYGLSETGPTHFDNPFEPGRKTGTVGRPLDIMDVKLFDEQGQEVGLGSLGEFGVKGPSLLKNYYCNSIGYEACFNKGYFMTGDLGQIDEKGIHYYVDRKKDLIIKGGINIVPTQIDAVIMSHQLVEESATIGKPDMFLGETIKSYVVLKAGAKIDDLALKLFCKERLGDFKTPSSFQFVTELPKGPSGKILKRQLREREN